MCHTRLGCGLNKDAECAGRVFNEDDVVECVTRVFDLAYDNECFMTVVEVDEDAKHVRPVFDWDDDADDFEPDNLAPRVRAILCLNQVFSVIK